MGTLFFCHGVFAVNEYVRVGYKKFIMGYFFYSMVKTCIL